MFTNKGLRNLIIPLAVEQLLQLLVGLADTFVVSRAGDAAMSGVSLVNSFNTVFVFLFTSLAAGGAVIISQYIGSKNNEQAGKSASQLVMFSALFGITISVVVLAFYRPILHLLFGKVEQEVMDACVIYLRISAFSYPAMAVYNAGAALCRARGKTKVTMYISTLANIVNLAGNIIGVFVLKLGVAGVAYPSLISRLLSAVLVTAYCFGGKNEVCYRMKNIFAWDGGLLKKILGIAVPNGVENGIHQLIKVAISSMVSMFGTYQIAALGTAMSINQLSALMSYAMGPVFTTVIGQCMGAGDIEQADLYFKKLMKLAFVLSISWNAFMFAMTPLFLKFSAISPEAKELVIWLVLLNNILSGIAYPFAAPLGNGLRAAGDVRFTMIVSVALTVLVRFCGAELFAVVINLGAIGTVLGMGADLFLRGGIFIARYKSRKWTRFKLI